jgi:hypothetical protein
MKKRKLTDILNDLSSDPDSLVKNPEPLGLNDSPDYGGGDNYYEGGDDGEYDLSCSQVISDCSESTGGGPGDGEEERNAYLDCLKEITEESDSPCPDFFEDPETLKEKMCDLATKRCNCELQYKNSLCSKRDSYLTCVENLGPGCDPNALPCDDDPFGACADKNNICNSSVDNATKCKSYKNVLEDVCFNQDSEEIKSSYFSCLDNLNPGFMSRSAIDIESGGGFPGVINPGNSNIPRTKCGCLSEYIKTIRERNNQNCMILMSICPFEACKDGLCLDDDVLEQL